MSGRLSTGENARLKDAIRVAAMWWAGRLMSAAPPPEAALFADALALQLFRRWEEVVATTRGEWPEDIAFEVGFPPTISTDVAGPILIALLSIGLEPRQWWKREGDACLPQFTMHFSMKKVTASSFDPRTAAREEATLFT